MSIKISELPSLTELSDTDVIAGVDTSENETSKISLSDLKRYIDTNTTYTAGTNINITNNVISAPNVYNKTEIDAKISSVYKYRGTVATYEDLPSTDLTVGDVYNVEADDSNYAWNGTRWDKLGGNVDLSGYQTKITSTNKLDADLVDDSGTNKFVTSTDKTNWNAKYDKPNEGIPKTDLSTSVQTSLNKADTALQEHQDISGKEDKSNKITTIDETSTDEQYPSAKATYDYINELVGDLETILETLDTGSGVNGN